ncbi:MAG: DUF2971 domain-containing protein [Oscillospiraceae bacterium]|jgi:hypothetical protein|nr:DUF2971 domain-containing protein [Oscillospiraceae bacterium]
MKGTSLKSEYLLKLRMAIEQGCRDKYTKVTNELKKGVIPDKLYRYTPLTLYTVENLSNKRFYLNKPSSFNDPFDSHYMGDASWSSLTSLLGFNAKNTDMYERFNNVMNKGFKSMNFGEFSGIKDSTGIVCFTENNPENIIMWSHYAFYHKGICFEYNFSQSNEEIFTYLLPVIYNNDLLFKGTKSRDPRVTLYFDIIQTCIVKSKEWEYENEWRIVNPNCCIEKDFYLASINPTHIYVGLNSGIQGAEEKKYDFLKRIKHLDKVKEYAGKHKIPIYQMKRCDSKFKLEPEIISC